MIIEIEKINRLINSRCKMLYPCGKIQYEDKWTWYPKPNEPHWKGFKRNNPRDYESEVNKIFDELHPF